MISEKEKERLLNNFNDWWKKEGLMDSTMKDLNELDLERSGPRKYKRPKLKRSRPLGLTAPPGFPEKFASDFKKLKIDD